MALSNWDTLAVDEKGVSTNGVFISPSGVQVEFYKNWLYVREAVEKTPELKVNAGDLSYKDVLIKAWRGPSSGVYAAVWSGFGEKLTGMLGCGIYGFEDTVEIVLREQGRTADESSHWCEMISMEGGTANRSITNLATGERIEHTHDSKWVGVQLEHIAALEKFLREDEDVPEVLKPSGIFNNAMRFNQGDAYFQRATNTPVSGTALGASDPPMILDMIEGMKDESRD